MRCLRLGWMPADRGGKSPLRDGSNEESILAKIKQISSLLQFKTCAPALYIGPIGNQKSRRGGTVINWRKTLRSKNSERLSGEIYRERVALNVEMNLDDKAAVRRQLLTNLENILKRFASRAENNAPT